MSDAMEEFCVSPPCSPRAQNRSLRVIHVLGCDGNHAAEFQCRIRQARLKPTRSGSHTATTRDDYNLPRGNWSAAAHNRRALVCYQ